MGKKYDMSFYPLPQSTVGGSTLGFNGNKPLAIVGPLKASQNYMRVLLTRIGERKEDPTLGTNFANEMMSGVIFLPIQIYQIFASNSMMAISCLRDRYRIDTPQSERVHKARLLEFTQVAPTSISMSIELTVRDGSSSSFSLPVPI